MKKDDLEDKINMIGHENELFSVLFDRIDMLKRIIQEQENTIELMHNKGNDSICECNSSDEKELSTQVDELKKDNYIQLNEHKNKCEEYEQALKKIRCELDESKAQIKEYEVDISKQSQNINSLREEKSKMEADVLQKNQLVHNLEEEKNKMEADVLQQNQLIHNLKEKIDNLKEKIDNLEEENSNMRSLICENDDTLKKAGTLIDAYNKYRLLPDDIKQRFVGLIYDENIEIFAASVSDIEKLNRIYDKIRDCVMQCKSKIVNDMGFEDALINIAAVFDFFYKDVCILDRKSSLQRLHVDVQTEYDDETCVRIGDVAGKIIDVLLQGYSVDNEIKARSIVLVKG